MTGGGTLQVVCVPQMASQSPAPSHNALMLQMNEAIILFYSCFFSPLKDSVPHVCPCPFLGIIMNILFFLSPL